MVGYAQLEFLLLFDFTFMMLLYSCDEVIVLYPLMLFWFSLWSAPSCIVLYHFFSLTKNLYCLNLIFSVGQTSTSYMFSGVVRVLFGHILYLCSCRDQLLAVHFKDKPKLAFFLWCYVAFLWPWFDRILYLPHWELICVGLMLLFLVTIFKFLDIFQVIGDQKSFFHAILLLVMEFTHGYSDSVNLIFSETFCPTLRFQKQHRVKKFLWIVLL